MEKVSNTTPLISVIVPIYNVEEYLDKCVNSILNQTYRNLEIILVDDGSPDNCPKMCDDYAKKDKRIKVIHKVNGGLSDARNIGINQSSGEYISFIDSDDYIAENYIEVLFNNLKKYNSDLSIGGHLVLYDDGKRINRYTNEEYVSNSKSILKKMLYDDGIDLSAWAKLYKASLFKNVSYPVGRLYEDAATTYKLIDLANKISVNSLPIYYYVIRKNSISNSKFTMKKMDLIISTKEMTDYIQKKYPDLQKACNRRLMYSYLSTLTQLAKCKERHKDIEKEIVGYIKKNKKNIMKDKKVPLRDKAGILSLSLGFNFFKIVWDIYDKNRGDKNE